MIEGKGKTEPELSEEWGVPERVFEECFDGRRPIRTCSANGSSRAPVILPCQAQLSHSGPLVSDVESVDQASHWTLGDALAIFYIPLVFCTTFHIALSQHRAPESHPRGP